MDEATQATQPSTLQIDLPKRSRHVIRNAEDIICVLRPNSQPAIEVVENIAQQAPQHVLFDEPDSDEELLMEDDGTSTRKPPTRNVQGLALRLSSRVRNVAMGFVFGRDPQKSDIILRSGLEDFRLSARHFRIYFNDQYVLMIQDHSTNGTKIDERYIGRGHRDQTRVLGNGSRISVAVWADSNTRQSKDATFTVAMPDRDQEQYGKNLHEYMERVTKAKKAPKNPVDKFVDPTPVPSVFMTASTIPYYHGMHWNGLPKYKVLSKIGSGAFATVYQLCTVEGGKLFAAKELDIKKVAKDNNTSQKVNSELTIVKKLSHPHIVKFCDWKAYQRWLYIIMEFVPFGNLSSYTTESDRLPQNSVKRVAHQISQALDYMHSNGVAHRDIKPENILIQSEDPLTVKLTDFGLSKVIQVEESLLKTFCGTLLYCAPEVYPDYELLRNGEPTPRQRAQRSFPYSSAVDVWSFGAVLYQLLACRPPIRGVENGAQMLAAILQDEIDYRVLGREGVEELAVRFLSRMLVVEARDRMTAAQCLQHPWIADLGDESTLPTPETAEPRPSLLRETESTVSRRVDAAPGFPSRGSFTLAANGRMEPSGASDSVFGYSNERRRSLPMPIPENEEERSSQWSPRNPMPAMAGFDSDDLLPDVQALANEIAAGDSRNGDKHGQSSGSSFINADGRHDQIIADSFYNDSDDTASVIRELTPMEAMALRRQNEHPTRPARLFGEVTSSGVGESGIFGRQAQPVILQEDLMRRGTSLNGAEEQMGVLQVSPPPELSARPNRPPHAPLSKRVLELSSDKEEATQQSKRSMTRQYRVPSSQHVSLMEPLPANSSRRLLGTLTPTAESFSKETLRIYDRVFMWGRYRCSTYVYPHPKDSRVPKCGLDILFCQPGCYAELGDETGPVHPRELQDTDAVIMTRKRSGIKVNGVQLNRPDENAGAFPCGKLRTRDRIEVCRDQESCLVYECKFYVGQSANVRKKGEKFTVEPNADLLTAVARRAEMIAGDSLLKEWEGNGLKSLGGQNVAPS